jgi:hypothetical protein
MKNLFFSALLLLGVGIGLSGCSNGDYDSSPTGNNANEINPLNPPGGFTPNFDWGAPVDPNLQGVLTCDVNGVAWKADLASPAIHLPNDPDHWTFGGGNATLGNSNCTIKIPTNLQVGQVLYCSHGNLDVVIGFYTNMSNPAASRSYNSSASGNGQIKILENDASHIKGLFFTLAQDPFTSFYVNITRGYFNVTKQ